jgi:lysophospholipase L1-like esterase
MHEWNSWVALGDSFTEGMSDLAPDGRTYLGWADRLAAVMAKQRPGFQYANLALRGKMLQEIIDEQVPRAIEARPDLVTICGGGNDLVVPGGDVDALAAQFEQAVLALLEAVPDVLIITGPDPQAMPVVRRVRGKVAIYNGHLRAIADRHGVRMLDLWAMDVLRDQRAWCDDRLHFSAEGHRRIALRAAEVLDIEVDGDWREPWPAEAPLPWISLRRNDLEWTWVYLLPWVRRQLRGESMGDGLAPKRPDLAPLQADRHC